MVEENVSEQNVFPYIPLKAWLAIRDSLKRSTNLEISSSFLENLLSVSGASAKKFQRALRLMGLINEDNRPTKLAERWRHDDEYAEVVHSIISSIYPAELESLFPVISSAEDRNRLNKWFMRRMGIGESQGRQYSQFYTMLKSGEIPEVKESATTRKPKTKIKKTATSQQRKSHALGLAGNSQDQVNALLREKAESEIDSIRAASPASNQTKGEMTLHIDLQIHISPDSSSEQIDKIFSSISKYIYNRITDE